MPDSPPVTAEGKVRSQTRDFFFSKNGFFKNRKRELARGPQGPPRSLHDYLCDAQRCGLKGQKGWRKTVVARNEARVVKRVRPVLMPLTRAHNILFPFWCWLDFTSRLACVCFFHFFFSIVCLFVVVILETRSMRKPRRTGGKTLKQNHKTVAETKKKNTEEKTTIFFFSQDESNVATTSDSNKGKRKYKEERRRKHFFFLKNRIQRTATAPSTTTPETPKKKRKSCPLSRFVLALSHWAANTVLLIVFHPPLPLVAVVYTRPG